MIENAIGIHRKPLLYDDLQSLTQVWTSMTTGSFHRKATGKDRRPSRAMAAPRSFKRSMLQHMLFVCVALLSEVATAAISAERRAFFSTGPHVLKPIDHPIVQDAAKFAVGELQKLSDSGIYRTLQLAEIQSATAEVGDFHYAVHLRLALASPHLQSGNATENYELLVMESKDLVGRKPKAERSIAIDEFPVMDEDAIEEFWIEMVETRRRKRAALFDKWREEASQGIDPVVAAAAEVAMEAYGIPARKKIKIAGVTKPKSTATPASTRTPMKDTEPKPKKKTLSLADLEAMPSKQLRKLLTTPTGVSTELRTAITTILDERLDRLERSETTSNSSDKDEL